MTRFFLPFFYLCTVEFDILHCIYYYQCHMTQINTDQLVQQMTKRKMLVPVLLFCLSHQPLAFLLGQSLHVIAPMTQLLGEQRLSTWADLLSDPDGPKALLQSMEEQLNLARDKA